MTRVYLQTVTGAKCPTCGGKRWREFRDAPDGDKHGECEACGTVWP